MAEAVSFMHALLIPCSTSTVPCYRCRHYDRPSLIFYLLVTAVDLVCLRITR